MGDTECIDWLSKWQDKFATGGSVSVWAIVLMIDCIF